MAAGESLGASARVLFVADESLLHRKLGTYAGRG